MIDSIVHGMNALHDGGDAQWSAVGYLIWHRPVLNALNDSISWYKHAYRVLHVSTEACRTAASYIEI